MAKEYNKISSTYFKTDGGDMENYYNKQEVDSLLNNKADKLEEGQIKGWTRITDNVEEELDIREQINQGYKRFTILVYMRKGNVRQGVKYELTAPELQKIGSKITTNMVCITRSCINPNGDNSICTVKQCVTAMLDENNRPIFGYMKIKYNLYNASGTSISGLDNFEYCLYAE